MSESKSVRHAAGFTFFRIGAGCLGIVVVRLFAFGFIAHGAGLWSFAGGFGKIMITLFAFCDTALGAGLRSFAGGISPFVLTYTVTGIIGSTVDKVAGRKYKQM